MYCEPAGQSSEPVWLVYSETAIIAEYWKSWNKRRLQYNAAHGLPEEHGHDPQRCIDDWIVVHWALEATPERLVKILS